MLMFGPQPFKPMKSLGLGGGRRVRQRWLQGLGSAARATRGGTGQEGRQEGRQEGEGGAGGSAPAHPHPANIIHRPQLGRDDLALRAPDRVVEGRRQASRRWERRLAVPRSEADAPRAGVGLDAPGVDGDAKALHAGVHEGAAGGARAQQAGLLAQAEVRHQVGDARGDGQRMVAEFHAVAGAAGQAGVLGRQRRRRRGRRHGGGQAEHRSGGHLFRGAGGRDLEGDHVDWGQGRARARILQNWRASSAALGCV